MDELGEEEMGLKRLIGLRNGRERRRKREREVGLVG